MARAGITYTEVANAARQLQAENKSPTTDNIRGLIGSGSKSTILRHLRSWKEGHALEAQADTLPLSLLETVKGLWSHIRSEADDEIAMKQEEFNAKIDALEKVLVRLQEQHASEIKEKERLDVNLSDARNGIDELSTLLHAQQMETVRRNEYIVGLERQTAQQSEENKRLHDVVKQTQKNLEHYQETNLRLKEAYSIERENERNEYLQTLRRLEAQINTLSQERTLLDHSLKQVENRLKEALEKNNQQETNCRVLTNDLFDHKTTINVLKHDNLTLTQQVAKLDLQLMKGNEQLCIALNEVNSITNEQKMLIASLHKAEDQVQVLMDEKLFLIQEKAELVGRMKTINDK